MPTLSSVPSGSPSLSEPFLNRDTFIAQSDSNQNFENSIFLEAQESLNGDNNVVVVDFLVPPQFTPSAGACLSFTIEEDVSQGSTLEVRQFTSPLPEAPITWANTAALIGPSGVGSAITVGSSSQRTDSIYFDVSNAVVANERLQFAVGMTDGATALKLFSSENQSTDSIPPLLFSGSCPSNSPTASPTATPTIATQSPTQGLGPPLLELDSSLISQYPSYKSGGQDWIVSFGASTFGVLEFAFPHTYIGDACLRLARTNNVDRPNNMPITDLQLDVYQQNQPWSQSESDIDYSNTIAEVDDNLIGERPASGPPVDFFDFVYVDVSTAVANPAGGKISLRLSTNKEIYFASKESVEAKPEIRLSTCSDWMNTVAPQFKTQPTFPTNVPTTEPVKQPPSMVRRSLSAELDSPTF